MLPHTARDSAINNVKGIATLLRNKVAASASNPEGVCEKATNAVRKYQKQTYYAVKSETGSNLRCMLHGMNNNLQKNLWKNKVYAGEFYAKIIPTALNSRNQYHA